MSYFQRVTVTVPVDTDDLETAQDTVEVRKLNYGERQRCMSKATKLTVADGANEIVVDVGTLSMEQLKAAIVSWSGPGFDGLPVCPTNVEALPPEIADKISKAVDSLNPPVSEPEKKESAESTSAA